MFGFGKSQHEKEYYALKKSINSLSDDQIRIMALIVYNLCKEFGDKYESAAEWLLSDKDKKHWLSILQSVFAKYLEHRFSR